jgi:hypothetical protein
VLAMSTPAISVYVNPLNVPDLGWPRRSWPPSCRWTAQLYGAMKQAYDNHRGYLWIKRKIDWTRRSI